MLLREGLTHMHSQKKKPRLQYWQEFNFKRTLTPHFFALELMLQIVTAW